jgi:drug/metabolite transporter (DMT)-like permease
MVEAAALPSPRVQRLALVALFVGALAIGSSPILVRLSEVGPIATAVWRLGLAALPMALWLAAERRAEPAARRPANWTDRALLTLPGLFLAADLAAWHVSIGWTSVANATLLANMSPVFVTAVAWLVLRERISRAFLAGLALAVAGTAMLMGGSASLGAGLAGDALALLAAIFYGGYILSVGRLRARFSTATIMLWSCISGATALLPFAIASGEVLLPVTLAGWAGVAAIAWLSHATGQGLIAYALAWLPTSFSSAALLISPVAAAALAWLVLAEPVGAVQILGGAVVLAGVLLARQGSRA